jgi:hypothetical protein
MKRWLVVGVAAVGVFLMGVVAGSALNRGYANQLRNLCLGLVEDPHAHAMVTMRLIASGRTDSVYDLAEHEIVTCAMPPRPQGVSTEADAAAASAAQRCAGFLKAFYSGYPDRKANFERRKPDDARQLGLASGP